MEPMDKEDALALLKTRVPFSESSKADAKALIQALERIPLAITHAAAYINTRAPMTIMSDYLELFRKSEANQVHLLDKKGLKDLRRDRSIRHAVIATWQISFTQIQKTEQSAADLLALMSMFDRQFRSVRTALRSLPRRAENIDTSAISPPAISPPNQLIPQSYISHSPIPLLCAQDRDPTEQMHYIPRTAKHQQRRRDWRFFEQTRVDETPRSSQGGHLNEHEQ